jgi:hypothetical protein
VTTKIKFLLTKTVETLLWLKEGSTSNLEQTDSIYLGRDFRKSYKEKWQNTGQG